MEGYVSYVCQVYVRIEWDGESMVLSCKCRVSRRKGKSSCPVKSVESSQVESTHDRNSVKNQDLPSHSHQCMYSVA